MRNVRGISFITTPNKFKKAISGYLLFQSKMDLILKLTIDSPKGMMENVLIISKK